ncbi:RHS repeat domain-containing protein [Thalassomonas actiniarum]|nr:RHS repeat-associated core domain-containing protein [Thalassomonas actiniarum]
MKTLTTNNSRALSVQDTASLHKDNLQPIPSKQMRQKKQTSAHAPTREPHGQHRKITWLGQLTYAFLLALPVHSQAATVDMATVIENVTIDRPVAETLPVVPQNTGLLPPLTELLPPVVFDPTDSEEAEQPTENSGGVERTGQAISTLERLKIDFEVTPETSDLIGEQINLSTGALSFSQTDLVLPGNGPEIRIARQMGGAQMHFASPREFGSWSLDLPHISTTMAKEQNADQYPSGWAQGDACTSFLTPGTANGVAKAHMGPDDYWGGETIQIPGKGSTAILEKREDDGSHYRVTANNWKIDCITPSDNPNGYEGFKVTTPDGTRYYFEQLRIIPAKFVGKAQFNLTPPSSNLTAPISKLDPMTGECTKNCSYFITANTYMLVSRIEDKHGNWLAFDYNSNALLTKISASDSREVNLGYDGGTVIKTISANNRSWRYDYTDRRLSKVTRPDNKSWLISDSLLTGMTPERYSESYSDTLSMCGAIIYDPGPHVEITHPDGAKGQYWLTQVGHGRTEVPKHIIGEEQVNPDKNSYLYARCYNVIALNKKTLTIPGAATSTWDYNYSAHFGAFEGETKPGFTTAPFSLPAGVDAGDIKWTSVKAPDNSSTIHYFSRRYDWLENAPLATSYYETNGSTLLKRVLPEFEKGPCVGSNQMHQPNREATECVRHKVKERQQIFAADADNGAQETTTYQTLYQAFNDYYQAEKTVSFIGDSLEAASRVQYRKQGFMHDTTRWLINQPTTTALSSDDSSYTTVSEIEYYPNSHASYALLPKYEKSFGTWQKYYSAYHSDGNIKKIEYNRALTSGSGNRYQSFSNYKRGQAQTITLPAPYSSSTISVSRTVDDNGWVTQTKDFEGNTTHYGYDKLGRIAYIDPVDTAWADTLLSWSYSGGLSNNQPVRTVKRCTLNAGKTACSDNARLTTTTTYDALFRPTRVQTSDGSTTIYQNSSYNIYNKPTFQSFPSTATISSAGTRFTYDGLQRQLTQTITDGGTVTTNYLADNKQRVTDGRGNATTTTYLAYGEPAYQQPLTITSPENVTTTLAVNLFGNVTAITQAGKNSALDISQTEYRAYDSRQRLCQIKRDDVGTTVMSLNDSGEILWQAQGQTATGNTSCNTSADAKDKVSFAYDNHGNQRTLSYGDGTATRTYTVNNNGDIKTITGGGFRQEYSYNSQRLLDKESLTLDGKTFTLAYGYDALGSLSRLEYPGNALAVDFAPNGFGQATQATWTQADDTVYNFVKPGASYYPGGSINSFTYGNGIIHKTTLNSRQLPSQIRDYLGSTSKVSLSYGYDNNNNITHITNGVDSNFSLTSLSYDGQDRLTATTGNVAGIGSSTLSYDGLGNIRSYSNTSILNPSSLSYGYNSKMRLSSVTGSGSEGYDFGKDGSYDSRGNVTDNGKRSFDYNLAGQMTRSAKDNSSNDYLYDGYNRRIKTSDSKGTSYSLYSQSGRLLYRETDKGGINYIFLGDKLVAKQGTGVVTKSDDADYNSVMNFKPFGETIETANDEVSYTGHKFDTDLGLSYMQARYYDPVIGRFYSNDPVGFTGEVDTFNRYSYVANNPYKYIDPDGEAKSRGGGVGRSMRGAATSACAKSCGAMKYYMGPQAQAAYMARKNATLKANRIKGKEGEAKTREKLGDDSAGEQVSFRNSEGKIARIDFAKKDGTLVETKTGNAQLSKNQKQLQNDIASGTEVTPVGDRAAKAGFKPGAPVKIDKMEIDRHVD